jgi:hypothetical protein
MTEQSREDQLKSTITALGGEVPDVVAPADESPFYCPGCGRRWPIETYCSGRGESPHSPILVVSTDELALGPENHTPAPAAQ